MLAPKFGVARLVPVLLAFSAGATVQFRSGVDIVQVDVSVMKDGHPVGDLTAADFTVRDNGKQQSITVARVADIALQVIVVLDVSGSVYGPQTLELRSVTRDVIAHLGSSDALTIITVSADVRAIAHRQSAEAAKLEVSDRVARATVGGFTSLHDAILSALVLRLGDRRRPLLVVLSDGEDTSSWLDADQILQETLRTDVVVHAITPSVDPTLDRQHQRSATPTEALRPWFDKDRQLARKALLTFLTRDTGGELMSTANASEVSLGLARIINRVRSGYVLSYSAANVPEKGWHRLEVNVRRSGVTVRARRGYWR